MTTEPTAGAAAAQPPEDAHGSAVPGAVEIVSRAIELNIAASSAIRRASLYAAGMYLLLLGPAALILGLALGSDGLGALGDIVSGDVGEALPQVGPIQGSILIGSIATLAVTLDLQIIAIAMIDDQAAGGRPWYRTALGVARRVFWTLVVAALIATILGLIGGTILDAIFGDIGRRSASIDAVLQNVIQLVIGIPFAYVGAAVVIGRTGPLHAVRTSIALARRRWRLALVIGIVNAATGLLAAFAIGAGADVLARIAIALGLDTARGPLQVIELGVIVAVGIAAIGSLTMTIGALTVAPQVVAYRGLGGPRGTEAGIELPAATGPWARQPVPVRPARLITTGMWVVLALLAVMTAAAIVEST